MRFHIGFSKRISLKKLIEIISFLFIGLLIFLGVYDKAHAEEVWNSFNTNSSFINYIKGQNLTGDSNFNSFYNYNYNNSQIQKNNTNGYGYRFYLNNNDRYFVNATSQGSSLGSSPPIDVFYVSQDIAFNFSNNGYCVNDSTDLKSMSIKFPLEVTTYANDYSTFNQTSQIDTFNVRIVAHDVENDLPFITSCTKEVLTGYTDTYYMITCNNIFQGNSNYTIDNFDIEILNAVPFNDIYNANVTNKKIAMIPIIGVANSHRLAGYEKSFYYSCSDDDPNLNGGFPGYDDDPGGLNDIYVQIRDNYSSDLPGIDTSLTLLHLPQTFTDLLLLPFDVTQAVVNNSNQCVPYDLDLSSIIHKWGSPTQDYHLRLPCMRDVLSNKLGNWYTIADMLICFFVFYEITMHVINLISAITSGEDLFSYFFRPSNSKVKYVDSSTGEVISRG